MRLGVVWGFLFVSINLIAVEPLTFPTPQWQNLTGKQRAERWNVKALEEVQNQWNQLRDSQQTTALIVVERGQVVLGLGPIEKPVACHSMRKSFLSALFGTLPAPQKPNLKTTLSALDIDDEPPLTPEEKSATLMDLLTARSGVYHSANYETSAMKQARPKRGSHPPGSFYYYNNWDFNALGTIFTKQSGLEVGEAFDTRFAQPLGMEDFKLSKNFTLHWDRGKRPSVHPAYLFELSTRDRARFGLMFLAGGRWASSQVVPEDWVATTTKPYSAHSFGKGSEQLGNGQAYGMLWWCSDEHWHFGYKFADNATFSARGVGGQYIVVIPSRSLVIVHSNDMSVKGQREPGKEFGALFNAILRAQRL